MKFIFLLGLLFTLLCSRAQDTIKPMDGNSYNMITPDTASQEVAASNGERVYRDRYESLLDSLQRKADADIREGIDNLSNENKWLTIATGALAFLFLSSLLINIRQWQQLKKIKQNK